MGNKMFFVVALVATLFVSVWFVFFFYDDGLGANEAEETIDALRITAEIADERVAILDVRTFEERAQEGYIMGSIRMNMERLRSEEVPLIPWSRPIYVYASNAESAHEAEELLRGKGFLQVIHIGSLSDWKEAGGSISKEQEISF